jgi:hypothetical protein
MTIMTAAALLAAACGSSPSSTASGVALNAGGSSTYQAAVAWTRCVRSHGVPDFPDPDSSGQIPKQAIEQLGVSNSAFNAAQKACQKLWPYNSPSQAQQRQQLTDDLKFAQCMRSHGLPGFPDPTNSDGRVEFVINVSRDGFDPHSPQILAKARECQHLVLPAGSRLPSVTETS